MHWFGYCFRLEKPRKIGSVERFASFDVLEIFIFCIAWDFFQRNVFFSIFFVVRFEALSSLLFTVTFFWSSGCRIERSFFGEVFDANCGIAGNHYPGMRDISPPPPKKLIHLWLSKALQLFSWSSSWVKSSLSYIQDTLKLL